MIKRILFLASLVTLSLAQSLWERGSNCASVSIPARVMVQICGCRDEGCPPCPCEVEPIETGEAGEDLSAVGGDGGGILDTDDLQEGIQGAGGDGDIEETGSAGVDPTDEKEKTSKPSKQCCTGISKQIGPIGDVSFADEFFKKLDA